MLWLVKVLGGVRFANTSVGCVCLRAPPGWRVNFSGGQCGQRDETVETETVDSVTVGTRPCFVSLSFLGGAVRYRASGDRFGGGEEAGRWVVGPLCTGQRRPRMGFPDRRRGETLLFLLLLLLLLLLLMMLMLLLFR